MKRIVLVPLVLLAIGCSEAANGNPLIGSWKSQDEGCGSYVFTATTQTAISPAGEKAAPLNVTYNTANPQKTYVIGNTGNAIGFFILDANTIKLSTYPGCTYKRVG